MQKTITNLETGEFIVPETPKNSSEFPIDRVKIGTEFSSGDQLDLHAAGGELMSLEAVRMARAAVESASYGVTQEVPISVKERIQSAQFATAWLDYALNEELKAA